MVTKTGLAKACSDFCCFISAIFQRKFLWGKLGRIYGKNSLSLGEIGSGLVKHI